MFMKSGSLHSAWIRVGACARTAAFAALFQLTASVAGAWSAPVAVDVNSTTTERFDTYVSTAPGQAGQWGVLWTSNSPIWTEFGVLFSRSGDNGASWSTPYDVSRSIGFSEGDFGDQPCLATDGGVNWVAAWDACTVTGSTIDTGRDILVSRSTDAGVTWSVPDYLNSDHSEPLTRNFGPVVACDGAGRWLTVWESHNTSYTSFRKEHLSFSRSTDGGATWSPVQALTTETTETQSGAAVAADGSGTWIVAWESNGTTDTDLFYRRSTDHGVSWSPEAALNAHAAVDNSSVQYYDGQVRLAGNGSGVWVAVWVSAWDESTTVPVQDRVVFARSTDNGQTWSPSSPIGQSSGSSNTLQFSPDIVWDGTAFRVIWTGPGGLQTSSSTDLGQSWAEPAALASGSAYPGGGASRPRLASRGGKTLAAWVHVPEGSLQPDIVAALDGGVSAVRDWSLYK